MNGKTGMRKLAWMVAAVLVAMLAACGGGGGGGSGGDAPAPGAQAPGLPAVSDADNTVPVVIGAGANRPLNFPLVSVTVCAPGSNAAASCATIDNVLLDTGSYGLRLFASAIPSATLAALAPQKSGANPVAECALFATSNAWGPVRSADIRMASEVAQNVPVHVWSDASVADVPSTAPASCQQNASIDTVADLGANGILGLGVAPADCPACARGASNQFYYSCRQGSCTALLQPVANQVGNPVGRFPRDNNGIILQMPQIPDSGAPGATGKLIFGIDTASNNALAGAGATVLKTGGGGDFQANYGGAILDAFADSGSNGLFFPDGTLPRSQIASDWYAPPSTLAASVGVTSANAAAGTPANTIPFHIANADTLFNSSGNAFNDLAGTASGSFDLGMPFFFGRKVYYGLAGASSAGGGAGPYLAYTAN